MTPEEFGKFFASKRFMKFNILMFLAGTALMLIPTAFIWGIYIQAGATGLFILRAMYRVIGKIKD